MNENTRPDIHPDNQGWHWTAFAILAMFYLHLHLHLNFCLYLYFMHLPPTQLTRYRSPSCFSDKCPSSFWSHSRHSISGHSQRVQFDPEIHQVIICGAQRIKPHRDFHPIQSTYSSGAGKPIYMRNGKSFKNCNMSPGKEEGDHNSFLSDPGV